MLIIVSRYLIPKGFRGFTFFPFVFLKNRKDTSNEVLLNHEKIHIQQQLEMLVVPFYIWYLLEFLYRLIQYRNSRVAYRNISFEREAYLNETNMDYLKIRKLYSFYIYTK